MTRRGDFQSWSLLPIDAAGCRVLSYGVVTLDQMLPPATGESAAPPAFLPASLPPQGTTGALDLRVWVVDDQDTFRDLLSNYLAAQPGVKLVGATRDHLDLLPAAQAQGVDLVILDLCLDGVGGLEILRKLSAIPNGPATLLLSAHASEDAVFCAAQCGAKGFLEKSDLLKCIDEALQKIRDGGVYFSAGPRRHLANRALYVWAKLDATGVSQRQDSLFLDLIHDLPVLEEDATSTGHANGR